MLLTLSTRRGGFAIGTWTGASRSSTSKIVNEIAHTNSKITTRSVHDNPRLNICRDHTRKKKMSGGKAKANTTTSNNNNNNTKNKNKNKNASSAASSAASSSSAKPGNKSKAQLQHQQNVRPAENEALNSAHKELAYRVERAAHMIIKSAQPLTDESMAQILGVVDTSTDQQLAQFKVDYTQQLRGSKKESANAFHHAVGYMESNMSQILYDEALKDREERAKRIADRKAQLAKINAEIAAQRASIGQSSPFDRYSMPPPPPPPQLPAYFGSELGENDANDFDWRDEFADLPPLEMLDETNVTVTALSDSGSEVDDAPLDEIYDVD
jgi:hypothetical protein